jgi:hypothetical protein
MKTILSSLAVAAIVAFGVAAWLARQNEPTSASNPVAVLKAATAFKHAQEAKGLPVPRFVSLATLTNQGLLNVADCGPYAGLDVTVSLAPDETRPQEILMAVRYPDGTATVVLCDGSVQSVTAARAAELPR